MKLTIIFLLLLTGTSCESVTTSSDRLRSLYRQRVPESKYVMYEFNIEGKMAFDGNNFGHAILDSISQFSSDNIDKIDASYVAGILDIKHLKMVNLYSPGDRPISVQDSLMTPTKEYTKIYNDIPIHISEYIDTYGTPVGFTRGGNKYLFDRLKEIGDSLVFYGISKKSNYGIALAQVLAVPKGNIKLYDTLGAIEHIEVKQFILKRGDIYLPNSNCKIEKDRPIAEMIELDFYPKKKMRADSVSDIGIYKRIK